MGVELVNAFAGATSRCLQFPMLFAAQGRSPTTLGKSLAGSAIIDGEIVVPAADGTTDFSVLQNELKE